MADTQVITFVITKARRESLCKVTSGAVSQVAPVTHMAFGDGGVDEQGKPKPPLETQTALNHELARYPVETVKYPDTTTAQYVAVIPADDLAGKSISEAALVDSAGVLCAIKTMASKVKDAGTTFTFTLNDKF